MELGGGFCGTFLKGATSNGSEKEDVITYYVWEFWTVISPTLRNLTTHVLTRSESSDDSLTLWASSPSEPDVILTCRNRPSTMSSGQEEKHPPEHWHPVQSGHARPRNRMSSWPVEIIHRQCHQGQKEKSPPECWHPVQRNKRESGTFSTLKSKRKIWESQKPLVIT